MIKDLSWLKKMMEEPTGMMQIDEFLQFGFGKKKPLEDSFF